MDDHFRPKQTITDRIVKFEPWLVALGIFLSTLATGIAAAAAFFTYLQVESTKAAVDQGSRNQAFAEFIKAKEDLCHVSLTQWDQMDGLDGEMEGTVPGGADSPLTLFVDYDRIMNGSSIERTRAYARLATEKNAILASKLTQLSIWLPREQYRQIVQFVSNGDSLGYREDYLTSAGAIAELTTVAVQYICRRQMRAAIAIYTGIDPEDDREDWRGAGGILVLPLSDTIPLREIMSAWANGGQANLINEDLEKRGIFAWDDRRRAQITKDPTYQR